MMLYPSLPDLLKHVDSRYLLVNVIAQRARSIAEKAEQEGVHMNDKPVSCAINDIAAGKIHIDCEGKY